MALANEVKGVALNGERQRRAAAVIPRRARQAERRRVPWESGN